MLKKIVLKMLWRKTPAFVRNGGNKSKTVKSEEKRSFEKGSEVRGRTMTNQRLNLKDPSQIQPH